MSDYRAPLEDMRFLLYEVFGLDREWAQLPALPTAPDRELADTLLDEAARITESLIAPLNRPGDETGLRFDNGAVITPPGFREAWDGYRAGGWIGLAGHPDHGGQGLPRTLGLLVEEMLQSAGNAFCLYGTLTSGVALALSAHGSEAQQRRFLPLLYSGRCAGAMCLTEAQAGTDLGLLRSRAEPLDDGRYRISGTKIFITGGEQDLSENILYLVLARLPDAPAGTAGISLFLVPRQHLNDDDSPGERNGVHCGGIERKMGIHASATCVLHFDGAEGWLVGKPHQGLKAMFTMMNYERLSVGLQGLGCAQLAYQKAAQYARERLQSRAPAGAVQPEQAADPILAQPEIRRLLLIQRCLIEGSRAFALMTGQQLDRSRYGHAAERERAQHLAALLTPVSKAFLSDLGFESCLHAQTVFGGHGYIREHGLEQLVRDARIAQIYEGTNAVQALDLVKRRVQANGGEHIGWLLSDMRQFLDAHSAELQEHRPSLDHALALLEQATAHLVASGDANAGPAAAVDYLHLLGWNLMAWAWARIHVTARTHADPSRSDFYHVKQQLAEVFFRHLLPRTQTHAAVVMAGPDSLMAIADDAF